MAPQRRIDVVLDSVKRLLRIGATANLLNLLQKQHPADLGQIFGELLESERQAAFTVLVERQPKLAMESASELGPERGAGLLAGRSAEEIAKLVQEIASDDAAALVDHLPEELSSEVLELMRRRESGQVESLLDYAERTAGRIMNPNVFALGEDLTVGEAISALQSAINVEMVFYLYVVDGRRHLVGRHLAAPPAAGVARNAAQADHDARRLQRPGRHRPGRSGPAGRVLQPAGDPRRRRREQAGRRHHRRRRHRRPQGRGHRGPVTGWPACRATSGWRRRRSRRCASACPGSASTS